jgi:small subunit ribosomal protein S17
MTNNTMENTGERGTRKVMRGTVMSDKMDGTIVVQVERTARHPLYKKTIKIRKKFYAHDGANEAREGDFVEIMGVRPMSKTKRWRLVKVLEAAQN